MKFIEVLEDFKNGARIRRKGWNYCLRLSYDYTGIAITRDPYIQYVTTFGLDLRPIVSEHDTILSNLELFLQDFDDWEIYVHPVEKYLLDTLGDVMSIFDVNDDVFNNIMRTIIINYGYYETCRLLEFIFNIHSNYEFNVRKVYEVDKDYFVEEVYPFLENPGKYYIIDSIRIKATRGKDDLSRSFHVGVLKRLKNYID